MSVARSILDFLVRRLVGAVFGGLFFDTHVKILINTIHLYYWLFLLIFPLILSWAPVDHTVGLAIYPSVIFVIFCIIKFGNLILHRSVFDKERKIKDEDDKELKKKDKKKKKGKQKENETGEPSEPFVIQTEDDVRANEGTSSSETDASTSKPTPKESNDSKTKNENIKPTSSNITLSSHNATTDDIKNPISPSSPSTDVYVRHSSPRGSRSILKVSSVPSSPSHTRSSRRRMIQDESEGSDEEEKGTEGESATSPTTPILSSSGRKSRNSTAKSLGERDSEVSTIMDSMMRDNSQWPNTEEQDLTTEGPSLKTEELSDGEMSEGEIRPSFSNSPRGRREEMSLSYSANSAMGAFSGTQNYVNTQESENVNRKEKEREEEPPLNDNMMINQDIVTTTPKKQEEQIFSYVDEFGELQHYVMYSDDPIMQPDDSIMQPNDHRDNMKMSSSSLPIIPAVTGSMDSDIVARREPEAVTPDFDSDALMRFLDENYSPSYLQSTTAKVDTDTVTKVSEPDPKPQIQIWKWRFPVNFKRLFLLDLLDRDDNIISVIMAIILATLTGYLGFRLMPFYYEFSIFVIWFIVATCQYSLFKSPQPDVPSPRHDFNKLNAFNRAFYFCLFASTILILDEYLKENSLKRIILFSINLPFGTLLANFKRLLLDFLLWFPLIYVSGLLPQVNTFFMYATEQINIHFFGSSGSPSLAATLIDFLVSACLVAGLYGIGYAANMNTSFLFSLYLGVMVGMSFLHSRTIKEPANWAHFFHRKSKNGSIDLTDEDLTPPDPSSLPFIRLIRDIIATLIIIVIVTGIHITGVFGRVYPAGFYIVAAMGVIVGFVVHYLIPMLRKPYPFMIFKAAFLESAEVNTFEAPNRPAEVMWFEKLFASLKFIEISLLFPITFLIAITEDTPDMIDKFGLTASIIMISIIGVRLFRGIFTDNSQHYLILFFTLLFFHFDARRYKEAFIINYFISAIIVYKLQEVYLKVTFMLIYAAPWNLSWGSAVHALIQPLGLPHTVLWLIQVLWSSLVSSPLYPFMGSTAFFSSYGRPVKFWERSYKTNRVDNSQIKLSESINGSGGTSNLNNLNSIFYEHLMISLQSSLESNVESGRLGNVSTGDFFIIVNDKLTALVHLIELGNGYCTFQLRGMEFKGTYCQERELEEINRSEYTNEDGRASCLPTVSWINVPGIISFKDMLRFRWNSWQPINTALMLKTYSISLNPAASIFNSYTLRKTFIQNYVNATIYYLIKSQLFESWVHDPDIAAHVLSLSPNHVDMDPIFTTNLDLDFDSVADGISMKSFGAGYAKWIQLCFEERLKSKSLSPTSPLTIEDSNPGGIVFNLCYCMSLLARRCLMNSEPTNATNLNSFLSRVYAMFKGDIRISSTKDEFILSQVDIIQKVVGKSIRMSLRLHQDTFVEDFEDLDNMYSVLEGYENDLVCCHEGDPRWRSSILSNVNTLISLRKQMDSNHVEADHVVLSLTLRHMKFRVIKLNRESVRGLWTGQVQELVFLGNTNMERGSIQQLRTVVRNLVNQSCDFPVGYPIYVSPLTTSYNSFWPEIFGDWKVVPDWVSRLLWREQVVKVKSTSSSNSNTSTGLPTLEEQ